MRAATVVREAASLVKADVPRDCLAAVTGRRGQGVERVSEPRRPVTDATSEGTTATGSSRVAGRGFGGAGARRVSIDLGFSGYLARIRPGSELPYRDGRGPDSVLERTDGGTPHGTGVADDRARHGARGRTSS